MGLSTQTPTSHRDKIVTGETGTDTIKIAIETGMIGTETAIETETESKTVMGTGRGATET